MGLLSEKNIIESLQQFSEMPSEKCWESIAQNLPPVNPIPGNTSVDPSSTSQSFTQFFSGVAGKITAIATTAIVATSVGLLYYYNTEKEPSNKNIAQTEIVKTSEAQIDETKELNIVENAITENITPEKTDNIYVEKQIKVDKKENVSEQKNTGIEKIFKSEPSQTEKQIKKDTLSSFNSNNPTTNATKTPTKTQEPISQKPTVKEEVFVEDNTDKTPETTEETHPLVAKSNTIDKLDVSQVIVPNVFTPNNDGYNDYLIFKNLDSFPKNRLIIVNSKGNKVYERYQYDNSWDAPNLPDGSYFFILEISDGNLSSTIQGVVQVLR